MGGCGPAGGSGLGMWAGLGSCSGRTSADSIGWRAHAWLQRPSQAQHTNRTPPRPRKHGRRPSAHALCPHASPRPPAPPVQDLYKRDFTPLGPVGRAQRGRPRLASLYRGMLRTLLAAGALTVAARDACPGL